MHHLIKADLAWFVPSPDAFGGDRIDRSLGLRPAMRFHQERVVPGIGGVLFVRQLSWAVAGIALARRVSRRAGASPVLIANAIEALACKVQFRTPIEGRTFKGSRRFAQELAEYDGLHEWRYEKLSQKSSYVEQPYRQSTTRALPSDTGLGFTDGSHHFNGMELTANGRALADAILQVDFGNTTLERWLSQWINGSRRNDNLGRAEMVNLARTLAPCEPSGTEKTIVQERLLSLLPEGCGVSDRRRRIRLADILFRRKGDPDLNKVLEALRRKGDDGARHADEIGVAVLFEEMRDAAVTVLAAMHMALRGGRGSEASAKLARVPDVAAALARFKTSAGQYAGEAARVGVAHDLAMRFAAFRDQDPEQALISLARSDGRVLTALDGRIAGGLTFHKGYGVLPADASEAAADTDDDAGENANIFVIRPWRLFQFHRLLKDAR